MKKFTYTILLTIILLVPVITFAESFTDPAGLNQNPSTLVGNVIRKALGIVGILAVLLFLLAGFTWMNAKGDANKISEAQKIMLWVAIGLLVIFGSYTLLSFVFKLI
jgi:hypothetical protein